ncbi:MAG: hypothetical protein SP1CHLAM54_07870 [Chlamydiia bacterium]|nr:hypothetical protein [Chlamydiia bacterium]MCH9615693.1 hypothetical protein [Chlamydiia bacterium]MCH9628904.1 hypothetical protein [Chlamydiia bacterium]
MNVKNALLLILLACFWGPNFLLIKLGIQTFSPFALVFSRLIMGAFCVIIIAKSAKHNLLKHVKMWPHFLWLGFLANAFPFALITYGEKVIPSAVAGIVNGSTPIFVVILSCFFLKDEGLNLKKIFGVLLGVAGLLFVFVPSLVDEVACDQWGILAVAIASGSYAMAMVHAKRFVHHIPGLVVASYQLLFASIMTLPFALFVDPMTAWPSTLSLWSAIALGTVGTGGSFILYYVIIRRAGATYLSTSTLLFPVIAIFLGVIFLNEDPGFFAYIGSALILLGLVFTSQRAKNTR